MIRFKVAIVFSALSILVNACITNQGTTSKESLRIELHDAQQELFAYVVRSTSTGRCEVAVATRNKLFPGPIVDRPLMELVSLAAAAQKQVASPPMATGEGEIHKLVVSYSLGGKQTFSLSGKIPDLLKVIHSAPDFEELLMVTSREQPKAYRILDDPKGGQFMKPLKPGE